MHLLPHDSASRDPGYFGSTTSSAQSSDNWILRFSSLKRMYKLMSQYFTDVMNQPVDALEVPDLQAMAKEADMQATLAMCRLTIVIAVQSSSNKDIIGKIQQLDQEFQHCLMRVIEQVRGPIYLNV